jgi:hypothetical protein
MHFVKWLICRNSSGFKDPTIHRAHPNGLWYSG